MSLEDAPPTSSCSLEKASGVSGSFATHRSSSEALSGGPRSKRIPFASGRRAAASISAKLETRTTTPLLVARGGGGGGGREGAVGRSFRFLLLASIFFLLKPLPAARGCGSTSARTVKARPSSSSWSISAIAC